MSSDPLKFRPSEKARLCKVQVISNKKRDYAYDYDYDYDYGYDYDYDMI